MSCRKIPAMPSTANLKWNLVFSSVTFFSKKSDPRYSAKKISGFHSNDPKHATEEADDQFRVHRTAIVPAQKATIRG
jgi:hypothetical protein